MRPEPSTDGLIDRIEMREFIDRIDLADPPVGDSATQAAQDGDTPTTDHRPTDGQSASGPGGTEQPASRQAPTPELRAKRRARRLLTMAAAQVAALAGAYAAMAMPWYQVSVGAMQVMTASGRLVAINPVQVSASGFDVAYNGATSPFCPATPLMWGLPVPLTLATVTVALVVVAVALRSIIAASAAVITALQAVRHLGIMHASVTQGPEGCLIGELSVQAGRPLFVIALSAVVVLSGLLTLQLWMLRSAEKQAKIAAGESVPPSLIAMIQGRLVGVAAAVVAEANRR